MKEQTVKMLQTHMEAQKAKGMLSLELLMSNPVGIGDHSTTDFYNNAVEALKMIAEADDCIDTLRRYTDGHLY
jgi:hypothetical protein